LPDPLVVCRALSKTYLTAGGGIEALHSVDASFEAGAVTAVVGASGSGKSTLLRAIAGLDRPTSGDLIVAGESIAAATPAELRRHRQRRVTYVSQKAADNFIPHLTLAQHAEDTPELARELLADFGVSHRIDSKPIELSGGEQARAAFALALARDTPLVVVDEPTAELDRDSAGQLLEAIRHQAGTGVAFVIATHDPDVTAIADQVLRLDRGRVAAPAPLATPGNQAARTVPEQVPVVVAVQRVNKSFRQGPDEIHAVRDVSFELRAGEVGVLLGRSGSGKSTLLTLMAGWQPPDTGQVIYTGSNVAPAHLRWSELSFLPQRFGLLGELSVRENVQHPARLAGTLKQQHETIEQLLDQFGLAELANRPPHETSIGQQQRAALARALALRPTILLADEPSSHQDAGWRDTVWRLLLDAAEQGTTCLIATHEEEAAQYATRLWHITEGAIDIRTENR
jgi:putative ABC transport system ATP-binding protein